MDAIDGSEPSMDAIDYASSMATKQGGFELMVNDSCPPVCMLIRLNDS